MATEHEQAVAEAGVGAMLAVMGVGGVIGLIKDAHAGKKAMEHPGDGPATP